ncbi:MAG: tetratricopeptide repeat protein, partial [Phycisphaerales bacterium]
MRDVFGKHQRSLICLSLVSVTLAIYWPVFGHEFVRYDDDKYVTENPHVTGGITRESVAWAFTRPHFHMWHPLTSLSHLLDCQLFGLNPRGHHLSSLLLHMANVALLSWVLCRLTGAIWPSAFAAAVFALHPLQVESVAWIAERKNVLSAFFWLLTMTAYFRYAERPNVVRYLLVVVLFSLGLMAKPMIVTLPFVLLLLDIWPLGRIQWRLQDATQGVPKLKQDRSAYRQFSTRRVIAEKVPLLIPAAFVSAITYLAQHRGGVMSDWDKVPLDQRLINAVTSYLTYIEKMIWPSKLAVFYPHPGGAFSVSHLVVSALVLSLISAYCIYAFNRRRYPLIGWLWYLGTLVPVIGLVQVGAQARADRYMYVPMIGLLLIVVFGVRDVLAKWHYRSIAAALTTAAVLSGAAACTRLQLRHWQNSVTLFKHTLDVTQNNYVMHNNYANLLSDLGRTDEAIWHYTKSLELRGDSVEVHNNVGNALVAKGRTDEAIRHYNKAIELAQGRQSGADPPSGLAEAHYNLANALRLRSQFLEALDHYTVAAELRPNDTDTLQGFGLTLAALRRFDEAIAKYQRLLELRPDNVIAQGLLGLALANQGKTEEAIRQFRIVLDHRPDDVEMHCNLGVLL